MSKSATAAANLKIQGLARISTTLPSASADRIRAITRAFASSRSSVNGRRSARRLRRKADSCSDSLSILVFFLVLIFYILFTFFPTSLGGFCGCVSARHIPLVAHAEVFHGRCPRIRSSMEADFSEQRRRDSQFRKFPTSQTVKVGVRLWHRKILHSYDRSAVVHVVYRQAEFHHPLFQRQGIVCRYIQAVI